MPVTLTRFDAANYLDTPELQLEYLRQCFEEGDPTEIAQALGVVARARGMATVARDSGLGRESLYKSLSETGNPEFATILKVIQALGMKLTVLPT